MDTEPNRYLKVSKDRLRAVNPTLSENAIIALRDAKINAAFDLGYSVIVEDSNLDPKHEERFSQIAKQRNVTLECIDLTVVPLSEAQARNWERDERLPPAAIAHMHKKYVQGTL